MEGWGHGLNTEQAESVNWFCLRAGLKGGHAGAHTYHAEGVMCAGEGGDQQSCLRVMLTAGPCDDQEAPRGCWGPRYIVPLQVYSLRVHD